MDDDGVQKMEVNRSTQSIWRVVRQAIAAGAFRSTMHPVIAPPFGISPSRSRWRILKHVILATLRLQSRWRSLPNLRDLKLKSIIGADDGYGKVYTAFHRQTGQDYALKELHYNSSQRQQISREVNFLKELDHPNLVKCYGVFFTAAADDYDDADSGLGCLLLEPLERGSPRVTDESDLVCIVRQLLLGLNYLHQRGIPHGDIKPSNVFVNHTGQVKLLYAGKILSPSESGSSHDGFSWDIWCVGLCILKFSENMRKPSEELLRFISACMRTDLLKRWTAEQLVNHPLFYQLPPGQKEAQLPPSKKEVQLPPWLEKWKKEVQLPTIKKEFQTPQLKKEKGVFHEREELMSPVNKKPKFLMEDDDYGDGLKDMESLKDPTKGVLHVVPERCIEHCQLFLPDCEFEKDKLVRMWIAEECIEVGMTKRMEDVGNLYFDALVQEEVILPSKFDNLHKQMKYKFNMSQVSGGILKEGMYLGISASNVDEIYKEVLYITWHCTRIDRTFSDALKNLKQLHTLVVHEDQCTSISQLPNDIFLGLRLLRTLDLSRTHISEVPGSIGKLESLQYLDISETPVKRLPESLDRLYCLQTLNLKACGGISALPRGFGRLVNLRHLDLDIVSQLKFMPRGMGNLIELQTLYVHSLWERMMVLA